MGVCSEAPELELGNHAAMVLNSDVQPLSEDRADQYAIIFKIIHVYEMCLDQPKELYLEMKVLS